MKESKDHTYIHYVNRLGTIKTMALFGATGVFCDEVIFTLLVADKIYLAGGRDLDNKLIALDCQRYKHVKKHSVSTINYYDISQLYLYKSSHLNKLIQTSIYLAKQRKNKKTSQAGARLRDLPNMHFTIERMMKKAGIKNVESFLKLAPEQVFKMVQEHHGQALDIDLLWKFAGAMESCHWSQIDELRKQQLLLQLGDNTKTPLIL